MFTGLVEERGRIDSVVRVGEGIRFGISAHRTMEGLSVNDSIAVNGCCLTVVGRDAGTFHVDVVEETLKKTTLGGFRAGREVNLERAMKLSDRLGGHLVLGHVDGVGRILSIERRTTSWWVGLEIPAELGKYVIRVGSIAVDGISLTAAEVEHNVVSVSIIPHTWEVTCFSSIQVGDPVNIEVDMVGKYVERLCGSVSNKGITEEWLKEKGY